MIKNKTTTLSPIISILLSFLASSHHWLHMGIIMLLGGSTNAMTAMTGVIWLRRLMIIMTMGMVLFSIYRLVKHKCNNRFQIVLNIISIIISVIFIGYTIIQFGW